MAEAGQIEFFDDRFDALVQPAAAQAVGTAEEAEVLFDGQRRVEGEFLRYVADMGPGLGSGGSQVDAGYGNLPERISLVDAAGRQPLPCQALHGLSRRCWKSGHYDNESGTAE